jgi:hypothetical protein
MKAFLNRYMAANRDLQKQPETDLRAIFEASVDAIRNGIGPRAFRPFGGAVNAAALDSVLYGVASRLSAGPVADSQSLAVQYNKLLKSNEYIKAITQATANQESVRARLDAIRRAFAAVP